MSAQRNEQSHAELCISSEIDAQRKKMTVLSPMPGKLPSKTAILGVSTIFSWDAHALIHLRCLACSPWIGKMPSS